VDALLVAVLAALLGAYVGHRGWLRELRARQYAAYVTCALDVMNARMTSDQTREPMPIGVHTRTMDALQMVHMHGGDEVRITANQLHRLLLRVADIPHDDVVEEIGASIDVFRGAARSEVLSFFPWRQIHYRFQRSMVRPDRSRR